MRLINRLSRLLRALRRDAIRWPAVDLALPGGRNLHLVGSIHMGTPEMAPLPPGLLARLNHADALIVEADITTAASPFTTPDQPLPPLAERLCTEQWQALSTLIDTLHLDIDSLEPLPLWQVALMLQAWQARQLGLSPDYGIDAQLLHAAHRRALSVRELEGAGSQLALLEQLADDGRELLADTLTHWHTNARLLQLMMSWWLEKAPARRDIALPNTFSSGLYDILMHQRNRQWVDYLYRLPPGDYVVAVGALHLYGEGNLPEMLSAATRHHTA